MSALERLEVHVDLGGDTLQAGTAYFHRGRGQLTSTTFTYDAGYLTNPDSYALDPALPMTTGAQHVQGGLPGAFSDCAPDRWGRNLIKKLERATARAEGRKPQPLDDAGYLVGVSDITRQGALRFRVDGASQFLASGSHVPRTINLRRLLRASEHAARDTRDAAELTAVKELLDAGTGSLGGARPKASVQDDSGTLLIAKFPHPDDQWDVMAWEATALDLATKAGVTVPAHRLIDLDGAHVLLLERFDREGHDRIGYMSAMTALERRDGEGGDYEEVADALSTLSGRSTADARELYRRVALSVGLNNTDDHLRNHGFLRRGAAWELSPAFDINPNPDDVARQTAIVGTDTRDDAAHGLALLAEACRLTVEDAQQIRDEIARALGAWRTVAERNRVRPSELTLFTDTFERGIRTLGP